MSYLRNIVASVSNCEYLQAELQKVAAENGVQCDGKESNERKNADDKNHHPILLQVYNFPWKISSL